MTGMACELAFYIELPVGNFLLPFDLIFLLVMAYQLPIDKLEFLNLSC